MSADDRPPFVISAFVEADQAEVVALILSVQAADHGQQDSEAETADLRAIPSTYQHGAGGFWIARRGGRLVGTIALKDLGDGRAFLKRMYVEQDSRGQGGVSADLLRRALHASGARDVYLGTLSSYPRGLAFYRRQGFRPVSRAELPSGGVIADLDDVFMHLDARRIS